VIVDTIVLLGLGNGGGGGGGSEDFKATVTCSNAKSIYNIVVGYLFTLS
jgi:hypothetical protein